MAEVEANPQSPQLIVEREYSDRMYHWKVRFPFNTTEEQFKEYVRSKNFFGFHPAGYGGFAKAISSREWQWSCFTSCD